MRVNAAHRGLGCIALAAATYAAAPGPKDVDLALALFVLIGSLWMTQALPLAVTALLVPVLATVSGLLEARAALSPFTHPVIFLFLGGFALAAALQRQGIDRALAHAILRAAGGHRLRAVVLLSGFTALLSMWISNTATAAMMLPPALGLLAGEPPDRQATEAGDGTGAREQAYVLLALAYSASIGGIATLVGSPPNAIAAAQAGIGFAGWLRFGVPAAALLWPVMMVLLWLLLRPSLGGSSIPRQQGFAWTRDRVVTLVIFVLAVAGWVGGTPLARMVGLGTDIDTLVALTATVALVATGCLSWDELESRAQWGVLLLFGGGLALSEIMQSTGASRFLAEQALSAVQGAPRIVVLAAVVAFVVFVTELVSNTASAALIIPILLPAAPALGLSEMALAATVAIAASCAFMLPVATPPNAIVFATERVPQALMMRCGLWLNFACIAVLVLLTGV